jgi:hypothetical protein
MTHLFPKGEIMNSNADADRNLSHFWGMFKNFDNELTQFIKFQHNEIVCIAQRRSKTCREGIGGVRTSDWQDRRHTRAETSVRGLFQLVQESDGENGSGKAL